MGGPFRIESKAYNIELGEVFDTDLTSPAEINKRGVASYCQGLLDQAFQDFDKAIHMDPEHVDALYNRGLVYYRKGKYDQAISDCNLVLGTVPQYAKAYYVRGLAYASQKRLECAISDLGRAIEIGRWSLGQNHIDVLWAMNHLARMQATCPEAKLRDGNKAVEFATHACELTDWNNPYFVDTLAAAFAATGNFELAVKWQEKAIDLFGKDNASSEDMTEYDRRLKLYQSSKPYREEL